MSDRLLREAIRGILREEIVSVTRGSEEATYDADFNTKGNIVRARKVDLDEYPGMEDLLKYARKFTSVSQGVLFNKLVELEKNGEAVRAKFKSPKDAEATLNRSWRDTISWPGVNRVGKGEVAMKLAYETDLEATEPDFVSATGAKLSVKQTGETGTSLVLTGGSSETVRGVVNEIQAILGIKSFPQSTWREEDMRETLAAMDPKKRVRVISQLRDKFDELKNVIVAEHNALGIMMVDLAHGFYFVPRARATKDIKIVYIRFGGTRVEFGGPYRGDDLTSLERALNYDYDTAEAAPAPSRRLRAR